MKKLIDSNIFRGALLGILTGILCFSMVTIVKHQAAERLYRRELQFAENNDVVVEEGVHLDSNGYSGKINRPTPVAPMATYAATGEPVTSEPNGTWTPPADLTATADPEEPEKVEEPKRSTDFSSIEEYKTYMADRYGLYSD